MVEPIPPSLVLGASVCPTCGALVGASLGFLWYNSYPAEIFMGDDFAHSVAEAAERLAVSSRTLQRIAHRYVGLPPAAMIRRRRLQEAADRVRRDPTLDLAALANELGYADHAHLTRDFTLVLGMAPTTYRNSSR